MRVLIAGGSGFIGKHLVDYLTMRSIDVDILTRSTLAQKKMVINGKLVKAIRSNYLTEELVRIFSSYNCIINLAGVRFTKSKESSYKHYEENFKIAESIFEAAHLCNIRNVIQFSSISVYSEQDKIPWLESQHAVPKNFYGLSKLNIDNLVAFYNKNFNMNFKSFRLAQVIGIGERKGYMLDVFFQKAFKKMPIEIYGHGIGRRHYIYIKDILELVNICINNSSMMGIFNIGMNRDYSHKELAIKINHIFDNHHNIIEDLTKEEDKSVNLMDISKAKKELNWNPIWGIEDAIEDVREEMKWMYSNNST
ncbi:UDP-glucose 4-epimerase [Robertmurraya siralis]|uniref:UDP-glucose 4-epimerase n=1 Tax=Robertmurraya siralis TaxID=77777 RepID=A0A920BW40_9BACI|nr:NAD(P)-dependent oxidoreductase [Robertmurraya siralis]GIN64057.1 UDP-glucose 4-epimerase [Robertmurraya siralis]